MTARSGWRDYRSILTSFSLLRRRDVRLRRVAECILIFFFFGLRKTVWEDQGEEPASEAGKVDGMLDKGRKAVSVGSPGL